MGEAHLPPHGRRRPLLTPAHQALDHLDAAKRLQQPPCTPLTGYAYFSTAPVPLCLRADNPSVALGCLCLCIAFPRRVPRQERSTNASSAHLGMLLQSFARNRGDRSNHASVNPCAITVNDKTSNASRYVHMGLRAWSSLFFRASGIFQPYIGEAA